MPKSKSRKKHPPKRVLALPDLERTKTAVLNSQQVSAPKPLDAPVIRIVCFMTFSFSREAAVGAQDLGVDPGPVWARKKRHHIGNVIGLAEALKRWHVAQLVDRRLRLAGQKQLRRDR